MGLERDFVRARSTTRTVCMDSRLCGTAGAKSWCLSCGGLSRQLPPIKREVCRTSGWDDSYDVDLGAFRLLAGSRCLALVEAFGLSRVRRCSSLDALIVGSFIAACGIDSSRGIPLSRTTECPLYRPSGVPSTRKSITARKRRNYRSRLYNMLVAPDCCAPHHRRGQVLTSNYYAVKEKPNDNRTNPQAGWQRFSWVIFISRVQKEGT